MPNDTAGAITTEPATDQLEAGREAPELEDSQHPGWRDAFRVALESARRQRRPIAGRLELGRDRSKSLIVLIGGSVMLLVLFFGLFSTSKKPKSLGEDSHRGQPSLGRKVTPGRENQDADKSVTPMLSAEVRATDSPQAGQLTPEDVGQTARTQIVVPPPATKSTDPQKYAIGRVDFSDPLVGRGTTPSATGSARNLEYPSPPNDAADLKKASLVFVRSNETKPSAQVQPLEDEQEQLVLPAGTRLLARLQAPVSSATSIPAVAIVEYNYERDGQIVLPAGAKVIGRLAQVNSSGYVDIQFNRLELPDGTTEKIDASAMALDFAPIKGYVSGTKKGTKFLVRSLTGIGTMASYLVGPQGSTSEGVLSSSALMRQRLADNIGTAGQEEMNSLAFNQNLVVTVPGNTSFYIVMQKASSNRARATSVMRSSAGADTSSTESVPTLEELRQLLQLRREINELSTPSSATAGQPPP